MGYTEEQKASARGENNDQIKRAVVASLSCPSGTHTYNPYPSQDISYGPRLETRHLCQVFHCPPGLRPSQPVVIASRTSPDWGIAPCFAAPRPPQIRAAV